ncbi:biotin/lipoyl-containing protein [Tunturiibacter lichenicola]|uniref:biotin/lipoyl-containing protein n=1 Tax=Tunturiibacter lichenicola TaxID=2051959 RepID=UPI003D9AB68A
MPFMYELKLGAEEPSYTFVQQLVPQGSLVGTGQAVCTLTDGAMEFHVLAPRQGLVVEWFVEHGAVIEDGDSLARIVCEGESVAVPAASPMRLG